MIKETDALKFEPATVSVKTGDVVEWTNSGTTSHNVTFDTGTASSTMNGGDTYAVKFTSPGTFHYICTFHISSGMQGRVTVSG
jgi:plastocyanin